MGPSWVSAGPYKGKERTLGGRRHETEAETGVILPQARGTCPGTS